MGIEAPMGISASNCKDPLLRLVICYWTWLVLVSCCASQSAHAEQGKELHIQVLDRAAGGLAFVAGAKKIEVDAETAAQLAAIRFTVECAVDKDCSDQKVEAIEGGRKVLDNTALKRVLSEAGEKILAPFTEEIRRATRLRIQVPANLVKVAIDALQFDGQPLYVRKPIVYTIGRDLTPSKITLSKSSVGLLVSDRSTDPQRAVFAVADLFKSSQRLDAEGLDRAKLQKHPQIDFAVISAHGRAGYSEDDFIQLPNQEVLSPDLIARLRPQLVYFDSCNIGISLRYLQALQNTGVKYALAPILSNEAGNSSTLTINGYFRELAAGSDPIAALHSARKELYVAHERDELIAQFWRAFPFRIYALN